MVLEGMKVLEAAGVPAERTRWSAAGSYRKRA